MSVDRTREFLSLVDSALRASPAAAGRDGRGQQHQLHRAAAQAPSALGDRPAFMRAIGEVSSDLHSTSLKLGALTKLVKKRGMFGDSSVEVERLTGTIRADMASLNGRLDSLQTYIAKRKDEAARAGAQPGKPLPSSLGGSAHGGGASAGAGAVRAPGAAAAPGSAASDDPLACVQGIAHSDVVVAQLKGQLLGFTGSLKTILQTRSESIKAQVDRRQQFGGMRDLGRPLSSSSAATAAAGGGAASGAAAGAGGSGGGDYGHGPSPSSFSSAAEASARAPFSGGSGAATAPPSDAIITMPPPGGAAAAFQLMAQAQLMPEAALLEGRAADVAVLDRHISELSSMFSRLAGVVMEQGALVDRIEDNLDSSLTSVEAGTAQLQRYWERVSNNRALFMRITATLLLFVILFVLFG